MIYKFSVSNIRLTSIETAYTKEITTTKSIEINYTVTTTREIGADGIATNEYKDEERITVSFEYNDTIDTSLIAGKRYNIELLTGTEGGGISITLNNCLLTSYATRLSQDEFVNIRVEFSKIGAIDTPETMPTQQRVKFDGVYLFIDCDARLPYKNEVPTNGLRMMNDLHWGASLRLSDFELDKLQSALNNNLIIIKPDNNYLNGALDIDQIRMKKTFIAGALKGQEFLNSN